jgi:hypothetical protein
MDECLVTGWDASNFLGGAGQAHILATISAHLSSVDARGGCGIVLVVTPRRMTEMDDEIAIV